MGLDTLDEDGQTPTSVTGGRDHGEVVGVLKERKLRLAMERTVTFLPDPSLARAAGTCRMLRRVVTGTAGGQGVLSP